MKLKKFEFFINESSEDNDTERIKFNYMMLNRLQSDCEYFLHWGKGCVKHLYYGDIKKHISEMKKLWNNLSEKPEWLSYEEIENYEKEMINYKQL